MSTVPCFYLPSSLCSVCSGEIQQHFPSKMDYAGDGPQRPTSYRGDMPIRLTPGSFLSYFESGNWYLVSDVLNYVMCQPPQAGQSWGFLAVGSQHSPAGSCSHCKGPFQFHDSGICQHSENYLDYITLSLTWE